MKMAKLMSAGSKHRNRHKEVLTPLLAPALWGRTGFALAMCMVLCVGVGRGASLPPPSVVYTHSAEELNRLDLRSVTNAAQLWDTLHVLTALQGIVNRDEPLLYLFYCSEFGVATDHFWFDWLRSDHGWLKNAEVRPLPSLESVVSKFRDRIKGVVVYDGNVPATSNLGSTAAGLDDLLPVRWDSAPGSAFDLLVQRLKLPVKLWLVEPDGKPKFTGIGRVPDSERVSSGSAKVDACYWGLEHFLRSGRCHKGVGAYYVDSWWIQHPRQADPTMHTLSNHDYFIARRAFFFDLSPWADEAPNDDPRQPLGADHKALLEVLSALYQQADGGITKIGGFPPWPFKYTTHSSPAGKHEGVPTEWEFSRLISQFNAYKEADAAGLGAMANASFFQHFPRQVKYTQPNPKPTAELWRKRGYLDAQSKVARKLFLGHYVGDYDSPSWLYKAVPKFFRDSARGRVPLGWAFDPNLADRAPQAMVYAYLNATTNDYFIAGDSGAGYLNPRGLTVRPDSNLPSGLERWRVYCRDYYSQWDMTITGFILDGASGASTGLEYEAYRTFSPNGAGTHFEHGPAMRAGMATCPERDLPDDVAGAAKVIAAAAGKAKDGPAFFWARSILKSPSWYWELSQRLARDYPAAPVEVVDPYTFFGLIACHQRMSP
jgi:hypothetical protein